MPSFNREQEVCSVKAASDYHNMRRRIKCYHKMLLQKMFIIKLTIVNCVETSFTDVLVVGVTAAKIP